MPSITNTWRFFIFFESKKSFLSLKKIFFRVWVCELFFVILKKIYKTYQSNNFQ